MLHNNNKAIINKLCIKSLKANKMRNIFAILAIALTTLLITTTISGGITFYNVNKSYMNVSAYGVDADGYINVDDESLEKLKKVNYVDKVGATQLASLDSLKNKELLNETVVLEATDSNEAYEMMAVKPIEGSYPKNAEDVLVPTWVLDLFGIEKRLGEKIILEVKIKDEVKSIELNICGYYESLISRGSGRTKIFVANDFISKYNNEIKNEEGAKTAYVTLKTVKSTTDYDVVTEQLKKLSDEIGGGKAKAHPKYDTENTRVNADGLKQGFAVGIGILLVIFTGYLIIYNIFYISVTRDIKFYGLLKTIGTTSRQLKKVIIKQALILSAVGIPLGLLLGYGVASYIIPLALKFTIFGNIVVVSKSIYIFILSIVFSLITVYISCSKPGKVAGKVSPIEAIRYVSTDGRKKKKKKGVNGAKLHKMAWSNIIKSKKRVILSILSISLSAIMVIFTINITMGIDPEKHAENQTVADITVGNNIGHFWGEEEYKPIAEDIISEIKNLDIVKDIDLNYSAILPGSDGSIYDFGVEIKLEGILKEEFEAGEKNNNGSIRYNMYSPNEGIIKAEITAINADTLEKDIEKLEVIQGEINEEKLKSGKYMIYYTGANEPNIIKAGDKVPFIFRYIDEDGELKEIKEEFEIMAIVATPNGWTASNLSNFNIEEEAFKSLFPKYKDYIKAIDINLKDGVDIKDADKIIGDIVSTSGHRTLSLISKNYYIEGMKEIQSIFIIVGGIVSVILGLIGIINVTNTMITSIISRRVEFAMLESIGMTKNQIRKMILFEGLYYVILTSIIIIPVGLIVAYVAPMMVPIYGGVKLSVYLISVLSSILVISIIMAIIPLIGYKIISKDSIVERLRVIE